FLTKPVDMGPIATAIKKGRASAAVAQRAMELMATLNRAECEAMADQPVHGATDVTGFGLVGHAHEMAAGAGLTLRLQAGAMPIAEGALDLARECIYSGGSKRERGYLEGQVELAADLDEA